MHRSWPESTLLIQTEKRLFRGRFFVRARQAGMHHGNRDGYFCYHAGDSKRQTLTSKLVGLGDPTEGVS